jgi:exopolysaccharide production protein ExoQ
MGSNIHPLSNPARQDGKTPWLIYLFLAGEFFLIYHDLTFSQGGFDSYFPSEDLLTSAVTDGSPVRRIALLALGIFAIVTLVRHRAEGRLRFHGLLGWTLLAFVALALVSPLWAEDRALTFTRAAVFAILSIAAVAVARRFSYREIILWTFFCTAFFLVIGIAAELFFGQFRPFASGYRFAGTVHPNLAGIDCALLVFSGIAAAGHEKSKQMAFRVCALLGFVFLILTRSRTAFAAAVLTLAVYFAIVCSRRAKIALVYALTILLIALPLVLGDAFVPDLKSAIMLGRDDSTIGSLNGRTGIWDEIGSYVQRRPILGYGYGGFWTPAHMSEISDEEKWGVPNSHSAYLDYLLTLGTLGMAAYALLLLTGIGRAFRLHSLSRNPDFAFCGALLLFCTMNGLLESATSEPSLAMFVGAVVLVQLAFVNPSPSLAANAK